MAEPSKAGSGWRYGLARFDVLSDEQADAVHEHALRLLEEIGYRVSYTPLLRLLLDEGLDAEGDLVRLDRGFVTEKVALAPANFEVRGRSPDRSVTIGGSNVVLSPTGGQPFVLHPDGVRKPATLEDYRTLIRLTQAADHMHVTSSGIVEPDDLPVASRHMDMDYWAIRLADKPYTPVGATAEAARDCVDLAAVAFDGRDEIERSPVMLAIVNPVSPLQFDERMGGSLMEYSSAGQLVILMPFLLAGATAPLTLAGAVAQATAESLAGVALVQTVRPGTGTVFGAFVSEIDLHGGGPIFGTGGSGLATLTLAQMARRYGLPFRSGGAFTNSRATDERGVQESLMSLWPSMLSGPSFMLHAAGWLEGSLAVSLDKFAQDLDVLDAFEEILSMHLPLDEDAFALDAFREVGPGGTFLGAAHTLRSLKTSTPRPIASNDWKLMLDAYEEPAIDAGLDEDLLRFMAERSGTIERAAG